MKKQINCKEVVWELFTLTAAVAIIAAAVYFFLVPSHASVSSISGLGIILTNFIPLPLSVITMVLNVVLLIIGFITCGREFGTKTVYTSILLPVFIGIFERIFPNIGSLTKTQELDVLCYVLVVSVGLSILFNMNASSGGLDIVAKIMNKYLHIELGKAMSLAGMCVALSAALVYDKKTVVLSVLGTYFNGIVVDHFIFGQNLKRRVCIITKYEEELRNFILHELHSGATIYDAIGAYNLDKRHEIITIVDKNEYQKLDIYKRIAAIETEEEMDDMTEELIDRFGDIPKKVQQLLHIAALKSLAHSAYITAIEQKGKDYKFVLYEKANLDPAKIPALLKKYGNNMTFKAEAVPYFLYQKKGRSGKEKGENVLQMLREIVESIRELRLDQGS